MATKKVNGVWKLYCQLSNSVAARRAVTILLSFLLARKHLSVQF